MAPTQVQKRPSLHVKAAPVAKRPAAARGTKKQSAGAQSGASAQFSFKVSEGDDCNLALVKFVLAKIPQGDVAQAASAKKQSR